MTYEEGFKIIMEMISISIVVGILKIHGTTRGWTVWALSGDQRTQHVLKVHRGSIDVLYSQVEMGGYLVVRQSQMGMTSS